MAVELVQNEAKAVTFVPDVRPASATLAFRAPGGATLAAPAVSVDSIGDAGAATVSSVTDRTQLVVDDATGVVAGGWYWLAAQDGWGARVRVSEVDGTTVYLDSSPPGTIEAGDTLHGMTLSATVPATATTARELNHRLDWSVTDTGGTTHHYRQMADVVAMSFRDPVVPQDVASYVTAMFPGEATLWTHGRYLEISERASRRVKSKLRASGDLPHRVGDQDALKDPGVDAMRVELAKDGLVPAGYDPASYMEQQEMALRRSLSEALANTWVDADDDDAVDQAVETSSLFGVRMVRR